MRKTVKHTFNFTPSQCEAFSDILKWDVDAFLNKADDLFEEDVPAGIRVSNRKSGDVEQTRLIYERDKNTSYLRMFTLDTHKYNEAIEEYYEAAESGEFDSDPLVRATRKNCSTILLSWEMTSSEDILIFLLELREYVRRTLWFSLGSIELNKLVS